MISLKTAQHIVLKHATLKKAMVLKVVDTAFRVLAQDVYSRQDSPPFDKSIVDGFAVRLPDTRRVPKIVEIIETVFAGQRPRKSLKRGACVRIATGAMVSRGAGAIVKKEETRVLNARHVRILQRPKLYENILRKSVDFKKITTKNGVPSRGKKVKYPVAIGMGNEVDGIDKKTLALCDVIAEIPMKGNKESLNVSVAYGIVGYRILN